MPNTLTLNATDGSGSFNAYIAMPETGPKYVTSPAVIALQEIFGVNAGMRQICDALAAQGYIAICPDLFWRQEAGVDITDQSEEEWAKAFALFKGFDGVKAIEDIKATITATRNMKECSGKVGTVGYCLGGYLAYMTSAKTDVEAAVSYYGVSLDTKLHEAVTITSPLMLHIAEEDEFVSKDAQAKIYDGLKEHPDVILHSYAAMDHAFARPNGTHWNEKAATLANQRTAKFFAKNLK